MFDESLPDFPYNAKVDARGASFQGFSIFHIANFPMGFDYLDCRELRNYGVSVDDEYLELKSYVSVEFTYILGRGI